MAYGRKCVFASVAVLGTVHFRELDGLALFCSQGAATPLARKWEFWVAAISLFAPARFVAVDHNRRFEAATATRIPNSFHLLD